MDRIRTGPTSAIPGFGKFVDMCKYSLFGVVLRLLGVVETSNAEIVRAFFFWTRLFVRANNSLSRHTIAVSYFQFLCVRERARKRCTLVL